MLIPPCAQPCFILKEPVSPVVVGLRDEASCGWIHVRVESRTQVEFS